MGLFRWGLFDAYLYPPYDQVRKIKNISLDLIGELIRIADEYYPEIALGLAFQAFGGLRAGEVCSLTTYCIDYGITLNEISWLELDLRSDWVLRENKKETGQIKKPRIQPIHPVFMKVISYLYNKHQILIRNNDNPFQPFFVNKNGTAMIQRTYYNKFNNVKNILIERLSSSSDIYMRSKAHILMSGKFTPHILRYFFTQFIADLPNTNSVEIAYWRGDSSLDAAIIYLASSLAISEKIKKIQDETMKEIFGGINND